MDKALWNQILKFDLDQPLSEYGFSTRLAKENGWTKSFTQLAILEYKKFMYLAGTAGVMVSPSEIVDVVWHQHLIFTESYEAFCAVIGKSIRHVPSTHNKSEAVKFTAALSQTEKLYKEAFGDPPPAIWHYRDMYAPLQLKQAKLGVGARWAIVLMVICAAILPVSTLLRPVYLQIDNPVFMLIFIGMSFLLFIFLRFFNRSGISTRLSQGRENSFLFNLRPFELIYTKTGKVDYVIHAYVDQLIKKEAITIDETGELNAVAGYQPAGSEEFVILEMLNEEEEEGTAYSRVLKAVKNKPVFLNTENALDRFREYFHASVSFCNLFTVNALLIAMVFLFGMGRLLVGITRDKPVVLLVIVLSVFAVVAISFLYSLTKIVLKLLPTFYDQRELLSKEKEADPEWEYYFLGTAVLLPVFLPLVQQYEQSSTSHGGGGDSSTSCGSSCGSSCGGGCGGCGGD